MSRRRRETAKTRILRKGDESKYIISSYKYEKRLIEIKKGKKAERKAI